MVFCYLPASNTFSHRCSLVPGNYFGFAEVWWFRPDQLSENRAVPGHCQHSSGKYRKQPQNHISLHIISLYYLFQGLLIFVILVCKKNVIDGLKVLFSSIHENWSSARENELAMRSYSRGTLTISLQ